jgi:biotin carboxyl carrier protein
MPRVNLVTPDPTLPWALTGLLARTTTVRSVRAASRPLDDLASDQLDRGQRVSIDSSLPMLSGEGECLHVLERLVVSPTVGLFQPRDPTPGLGFIEIGTVLGTIAGEEVRSGFAGEFVALLAYPGERVRKGQPVAWLRTASARDGARTGP